MPALTGTVGSGGGGRGAGVESASSGVVSPGIPRMVQPHKAVTTMSAISPYRVTPARTVRSVRMPPI